MALKALHLVFMLRLKKTSKKLALFALGFSILSTCKASYANEVDEVIDVEKVYKQAQDTSSSAASKLNEIAKGGAGVEKLDDILLGKGEIKNSADELGKLLQKGEKLKESTYAESPENTKVKCTIDGCNVANVMGSKATHERESKLEAFGFKKDKDQFLEDNKGFIDKANYNAKKFREKFDAVSGSYKDCTPAKNVNNYKQEIECDEYYDVKYKNCPIAQVVEVDPKYIYQCTKKRNDAIKTCYDEITSIKCRNSAECDNNGIILSSVKTNLQSQSYNYPTLKVGTPYWEPYYCSVDRSKYTTFTIKNLAKVQSFLLERVAFDDYVMIKLNDHLIYHGPDSELGEDRIEIIRPGRYGRITTNGHNNKACERATNWDFTLNKELKQYLREGENTISITIATAGFGKAELWIKTTQHCCKDWDVKREVKCEYEGIK